MSSVYEINKGVNKAIEFKGLKAQYIGYLAVGLVALLLLFAITYMIGVPVYLSVGTVAVLGYMLFTWVSKYSHKYGQYGLMKEAAYKRIPEVIYCNSREGFCELKEKEANDDSGNGNCDVDTVSINSTLKK